MRRIKTVLAVIAVMAAILVAFAAPAMADDGRHNKDNDRHDRHDHGFRFFDHNRSFDNDCCGDHHLFDNDCCDDHDLFDVDDLVFTGFSPFVFAPEIDVDTEEVGNNNDLEGECFVTDIDGDGFIDDWEVEITCFV